MAILAWQATDHQGSVKDKVDAMLKNIKKEEDKIGLYQKRCGVSYGEVVNIITSQEAWVSIKIGLVRQTEEGGSTAPVAPAA